MKQYEPPFLALSSGLTPIGHANSVKMGIMPAAIWIEDPTETPMVSSILPFIAIQTEVTCSAA